MAREPGPAVAAKKAQTRAQVLEAGLELFLTNGFDQTSMDAVAAFAGVSKTTLYAHYRDKMSLFRAAFQQRVTELDLDLDSTLVATSGDAEQRLGAVLGAVLRATTSESSLAFLRIVIAESARRPDLVEIVRDRGMPHVVSVVRDILCDDADAHGYELPAVEAQALLVLRMAVASAQVDALSDAQFRPSGGLVDMHARWVAEVFLRAMRSTDRAGAAVAPAPPRGYEYPWGPGAAL